MSTDELKAKTCLVVDDSGVIRKIARRIVEGLGFAVIEAENGELALQLCDQAMPAVILLDWNMPVMDGHEFLCQLRAMDGGREPKVVFCTTENDPGHIMKALQNGADEYIMKPFDATIVAAKFREVNLIDAEAATLHEMSGSE